jgi:hypothetical protein
MCTMCVIDKLASSRGRMDEVPNQELAKLIVSKKDKSAIQELVDNLSDKWKYLSSMIKTKRCSL